MHFPFSAFWHYVVWATDSFTKNTYKQDGLLHEVSYLAKILNLHKS